MQGNSLFFSLEPHILFMWTSAVKFSHQLVSRAVCVQMAVRVCALCKRKVCSSHSFSRELNIPFFLNQLVSRAVALASCFLVSRLQGSGCCSVHSWRLLLSPPSRAKNREGAANQAISTDLLKSPSQQSYTKSGLFRLLHSVTVSFWCFLLTFCSWSFTT